MFIDKQYSSTAMKDLIVLQERKRRFWTVVGVLAVILVMGWAQESGLKFQGLGLAILVTGIVFFRRQ